MVDILQDDTLVAESSSVDVSTKKNPLEQVQIRKNLLSKPVSGVNLRRASTKKSMEGERTQTRSPISPMYFPRNVVSEKQTPPGAEEHGRAVVMLKCVFCSSHVQMIKSYGFISSSGLSKQPQSEV